MMAVTSLHTLFNLRSHTHTHTVTLSLSLHSTVATIDFSPQPGRQGTNYYGTADRSKHYRHQPPEDVMVISV